MEESFDQRHPRLANALVVCLVAFMMLEVAATLTIALTSTPPEFSATVASFDGLGRSTGGAAPTFRLVLRVKNNNVWRHCFKLHSAVVEYDGVPIARADDLSEFCVPARSIVEEVPVVATGEGRGLPDQVYEGVEARLQRQERVPLAVRLMLDDQHVVVRDWPMLLQCTAMLDGRPDLPSRCLLFYMERGLHEDH